MERTGIRFVAGIEPASIAPAAVKTAGSLAHRFAVIQETYRPDKVDMYFDEALWRRLVEFARGTAPGARGGIVVSDRAKEMDADDFPPRMRRSKIRQPTCSSARTGCSCSASRQSIGRRSGVRGHTTTPTPMRCLTGAP